jgi:long-chain fatty acid transport protein
MDAEADLRNVRRPPAVIERIQSQTVEIADNVPMNVGAGLYHRLQNDWDFTADVMWMEFSKFGVREVYLEATDLNVPQGEYNDFFMVSVGTSWPINPRMRGSVGAMWMEEPMDEASRTFGMALDEIFGIGAGITYKMASGNDMALSVDLLDTGSARIDTGESVLKGRVAGEWEDPYTLVIDFSFNWR